MNAILNSTSFFFSFSFSLSFSFSFSFSSLSHTFPNSQFISALSPFSPSLSLSLGVPLRVEIGNRDLEKGEVTVVPRDDRNLKHTIPAAIEDVVCVWVWVWVWV